MQRHFGVRFLDYERIDGLLKNTKKLIIIIMKKVFAFLPFISIVIMTSCDEPRGIPKVTPVVIAPAKFDVDAFINRSKEHNENYARTGFKAGFLKGYLAGQMDGVQDKFPTYDQIMIKNKAAEEQFAEIFFGN